MPVVSADLDGRALYSVAFSVTLSSSLVGMVVAGLWSDRVGAVRPLLASVALFGAGLAVAGLAPSMEALVAGRFVQGLGGGALSVSLYVLVAQVYAPVDRVRILAAFAAAWVLPGVVGPFLAGVVADTVGWRWVFLGAVVLAGGALGLLGPALRVARSLPSAGAPAPGRVVATRIALASLVALALLGLNVAGAASGTTRAVLAVGALAAALAALRPLLPVGTLRSAAGAPSVVLLRGLVGAAFFASEAYLPFLLQEQYGARVWVSGLVLTAATIGWASASQVQGRLGERLRDESALGLGAVLLSLGIGSILLVLLTPSPGVLVGLGWLVAASGMGLMYPRITAVVLARAADHERGGASAAVTLADAVGSAAAVAVAGLLFTAVGSAADRSAFVAVLMLSTTLGLLAVGASRRV
ncbi:MFS transporter [Nocardioides sp. CBS4Y-1]|uniref:MFS transporter n=2 Tax=Nocardioides acrostichi TaxID=2784339 RepID=A0A930Y8R0_9ACTN|nr:MFS transporter [Nocardioides acrostichi]